MQYGSTEPIMPRKSATGTNRVTFTTKGYIYLTVLIPFALFLIGFQFISITILILMVGFKLIWF
jgi:hypothetical protein